MWAPSYALILCMFGGRKAAVAAAVHGPHAHVRLYPPVATMVTRVCIKIINPFAGSRFSLRVKGYGFSEAILGPRGCEVALHKFVSTAIGFAHGQSHPLIQCAVLDHDVVEFAIVVVVTGGE